MITINNSPILADFPDSKITITSLATSEESIVYLPFDFAPKLHALCIVTIRTETELAYRGWFWVDNYQLVDRTQTSSEAIVRLTLKEHKAYLENRIFMKDLNVIDFTATYLKERILQLDDQGFGGYSNETYPFSFQGVLETLINSEDVILAQEGSSFPDHTPVQVFSAACPVSWTVDSLLEHHRAILISDFTGEGATDANIPTKNPPNPTRTSLRCLLPDPHLVQTLEEKLRALNPLHILLPVGDDVLPIPEEPEDPEDPEEEVPVNSSEGELGIVFYRDNFYIGGLDYAITGSDLITDNDPLPNPNAVFGNSRPSVIYPYHVLTDSVPSQTYSNLLRSQLSERWRRSTKRYKALLPEIPVNWEEAFPLWSRFTVYPDRKCLLEYDGNTHPKQRLRVRGYEISPFIARLDQSGHLADVEDSITGVTYEGSFPGIGFNQSNIASNQMVQGIRIGKTFVILPINETEVITGNIYFENKYVHYINYENISPTESMFANMSFNTAPNFEYEVTFFDTKLGWDYLVENNRFTKRNVSFQMVNQIEFEAFETMLREDWELQDRYVKEKYWDHSVKTLYDSYKTLNGILYMPPGMGTIHINLSHASSLKSFYPPPSVPITTGISVMPILPKVVTSDTVINMLMLGEQTIASIDGGYYNLASGQNGAPVSVAITQEGPSTWHCNYPNVTQQLFVPPVSLTPTIGLDQNFVSWFLYSFVINRIINKLIMKLDIIPSYNSIIVETS